MLALQDKVFIILHRFYAFYSYLLYLAFIFYDFIITLVPVTLY